MLGVDNSTLSTDQAFAVFCEKFHQVDMKTILITLIQPK